MNTMLEVITGDKREKVVRGLLDQFRHLLSEAAAVLTGPQSSFAEYERALLELSNEACRLSVRDRLQTIADQHVSKRLVINGVLYQRHQEGSAQYHSLCGTVRVTRPTYRNAHERNGATVVPLELAAGLMHRATPALGYRVALGYAQCPSRQLAAQLLASFRCAPSRSTLERIGKAIGHDVKQHVAVIEPLVRDTQRLPDGVHAISVGLDRTTIPMHELLPPSASTSKTRPHRNRPYLRARPEPCCVNYRMAYVGTVAFIDEHGETLRSFRYGASADEGPERVITSMLDDVRHAQRARRRRRKPLLPVGIVQDGAPEMWQLVRDALNGEPLTHATYEAIDHYHVMEHLAGALAVLPMAQHKRQQKLHEWSDELQRDDAAIDRVETFLRRQCRDYTKTCTQAQRRERYNDYAALRDHTKYITYNKDRMRYATMRTAGLPIGSGVTEGACKSLVTVRTKGSGQRWKSKGVNAVLTLRANFLSDRLEATVHSLRILHTANITQSQRAA